MTIPQARHRDKYLDEHENHPDSCLCYKCRSGFVTRMDDDEETGRYLAERHRPRECDFDGDHR